jgi:copper(I)-binding protein
MKRLGVVVLLLLASAGCVVQSGSPATDSMDGEVGRLRLNRVAVESPGARGSTHVAGDSAALLLTIANFGAAGDVLTGVSSNAARQVVLRDGDGEAQPAFQVDVPASGAAMLDEVTGPHLELSGLWETLAAGSRVLVTFEFRDAGAVTMRVPVRRYTDVPVDRIAPPEP